MSQCQDSKTGGNDNGHSSQGGHANGSASSDPRGAILFVSDRCARNGRLDLQGRIRACIQACSGRY